jgi:outer membrane protein TolC
MLIFVLILGLGAIFLPGAAAQPAMTISLQEALQRARANSPQFQSASIAALLAREDRVQAKAGLLPTANYFNQYIYTQGNGTPSGRFVANDGVHIYNSQAQVHGDVFAPGKFADYRRAIVAETIAQAKADLAARGLVGTVVQNYYALVVAERKVRNAERSLREAQQFLDISQKQEQGGEVAHSDVVKAQIQLEQRQRDTQDAQLTVEKSRLSLAVLLFPDFRHDFAVADDLQNQTAVPPFEDIRALAAKNNPEIRAAQAAVQQEKWGVTSARSAYLPTLSFDYFFGIDANQFAIYNRAHRENLGSAAQAQLTIPIWNWGATRSKVKQAQLHLQQAQVDLSATQRQLLANLNSFFQEAQTASSQMTSLRHSVDLASESLKLTLLRYQAGEVSVLEVVDAQTTLAQARNAYDDGLVRYRVALAELQTLTGSF